MLNTKTVIFIMLGIYIIKNQQHNESSNNYKYFIVKICVVTVVD